MKRFLGLVLFTCVLLSGCESDQETCVTIPDAPSKVTVSLEQFQDSLAGISSKEELVAFMGRQSTIRDFIFLRSSYPNDSVFINTLYERFTSPHFDTLLFETQRVFGDLSGLKAQFEEAFTNIRYYYPNFYAPKIQTVISGLNTDMIVTDSLIIVGLDYFLGRDAKYRPKDVYSYQLRKYDPNDIVPSCLLIYAIGDRFNKTDLSDKTVLADMIAYGKSFYFAKHMLPCEPDSIFLWYTPEEMSGTRKNEDLIWARFIQSQVLFSTSHVTKKDYLAERPVTIQVGEKCPGRIGQWVGWQIVNKYMATHPEITLPELMSQANAQKLFKESRYRPN
jgi:hypothetical protein